VLELNISTTFSPISAKHSTKPEMLTIGIINNMTADAFHAVERRFNRVLSAAAQDISIRVQYYATQYLPDDGLHRPLAALWDAELDGLLVTGAEPSAVSTEYEPLWPSLTPAVKWAADHTTSTIWSCMAGHIAARYLDAVERVCHSEKIFGVFDSIPCAQHPLMDGPDDGWRVPHSRWNDLPESALVANGYTILCRSPGAGIDRCVKTVGSSLFVLLQTHPEYGTSTLLREYRRDVVRYGTGAVLQQPALPLGYLDPADANALEAWCAMAKSAPNSVDSWLDQITIRNTWSAAAGQFFRNWLLLLAEGKPGNTAAVHGVAETAPLP
jgi:homoserine O-succinyltransferase/O-acetyltransferase